MRDSTVVPFARNATFLRERAMKQKRAGNLLDALELLRQATEAAPEGEGYWLDMAAVYADMGRHSDSRRMTLIHLFHRSEDPEAFYWLGVYDMEVNKLKEAEHAFERYLSLESRGAMADGARSCLEKLELTRSFTQQLFGKSYRELRQQQRRRREEMKESARNLERGASEKKKEPAEGSDEDGDSLFDEKFIKVLEAALEQMSKTTPKDPSDPDQVISAAEACYQMKNPEKAMGLLKGLDWQQLDEAQLQLLLDLLLKMKEYAHAYSVGRNLVRLQPYDSYYLHAAAVTAVRLGLDGDAAGMWQRLLRIDPEDEVARWYLNELRAGRLEPENMSDLYRLPLKEWQRHSHCMLSLLKQTDEQVESAWRENPDVRAALRWALQSNVPQMIEPALHLLESIESEDAWQIMLDFVARTTLGYDYDYRMSEYIGGPDHWSRAGVRKYMDLKYFTPDYEEMLKEFGVSRRQMIRMADEILREDYDVSAEIELATLWKQIAPIAREESAVRDLRCCAAALAMFVLQRQNAGAPVAELALKFQCSPRKLERYAKWMQGAMDARGEA